MTIGCILGTDDIYFLGETISAEDLKDADVYKQEQPPANDQELYVKCEAVAQTLLDIGFPQKTLYLFVAQTMLETGNYKSNLCVRYNNYSGIRYVKSDKYANGSHSGFATYPDITAWARRYKQVLSQKPAYPIQATNADDFYNRLYKNTYFLPKEGPQYATNFNVAIKKFKAVFDAYSDKVMVEHPDPKKKKKFDPKDWWANLPWYEKGGVIFAGGLVGLMTIKSVLK